MRKPVLSRLFSTLFAFVLFPLALFAAEPASAGAGTPAVPAAAPDNVFFKVSLNESFFIQEREAVVNARCTVDLLQGTPDVVSLEVFGHGTGQGEIFNVSGEKVRDWSIRRAGARTFLEIRPKDLDGVKSFTLTISGRQPLKLPTTISPMLFSGADAATFFGVVQFLATADLRLYAKQERGLMPIGERSRSEISYGVIGAPSLRLDIARTNDLLAPVSLENFSLVGDVGADGTRFRGQEISVRNALLALTQNAARQYGFADRGRICTGMRADFLVCDRDPLALPPQELESVNIEAAYLDGARVFTRTR